MEAKQVLDYLAARPEREDTLEGITNWWMKADKGRHAIQELEDALNLMLAEGKLEKICIKKDIIVYKLKQRLKA